MKQKRFRQATHVERDEPAGAAGNRQSKQKRRSNDVGYEVNRRDDDSPVRPSLDAQGAGVLGKEEASVEVGVALTLRTTHKYNSRLLGSRLLPIRTQGALFAEW